MLVVTEEAARRFWGDWWEPEPEPEPEGDDR